MSQPHEKEGITVAEDPTLVCERTRERASGAILRAVQQVWDGEFSEADLNRLLQEELKKEQTIFSQGWYNPPPRGTAVLVGTSRIHHENLRAVENWPEEHYIFRQDGDLVYIYASPIDRQTGIIGDIAMTLYAGDDPDIQQHLRTVLNINRQIAQRVRPGMSVAQVYNQACHICNEAGLYNICPSETDPTAINIGHSIPGTLEPFSEEDLQRIRTGDQNWVNGRIRHGRTFFKGTEDYIFKPGDCFTIEPRLVNPKNPALPMASYHTIAIVEENGARLLENFDEIFQATGMEYML